MFKPRPRQYMIQPVKPKSNLEEMQKKYPEQKFSGMGYYNQAGYRVERLSVVATIYREGEAGDSFFSCNLRKTTSSVKYELCVSWCKSFEKEKRSHSYDETYDIDKVFMEWNMEDEEASLLLGLMRSSDDVEVESETLRAIWDKFVCPRIVKEETNGHEDKGLIKDCLSGYLEWLFNEK